MSPQRGKYDPIHQNADGKWYFWDEVWSSEEGPYETETEAIEALDVYYTEQLDM